MTNPSWIVRNEDLAKDVGAGPDDLVIYALTLGHIREDFDQMAANNGLEHLRWELLTNLQRSQVTEGSASILEEYCWNDAVLDLISDIQDGNEPGGATTSQDPAQDPPAGIPETAATGGGSWSKVGEPHPAEDLRDLVCNLLEQAMAEYDSDAPGEAPLVSITRQTAPATGLAVRARNGTELQITFAEPSKEVL